MNHHGTPSRPERETEYSGVGVTEVPGNEAGRGVTGRPRQSSRGDRDAAGRETVRWLLDEVQLVKGWERFVRRAQDTERIELVVSGSSARMLSREVHTSLRGRGMETVIRPFLFREFLRHRGAEPTKHARKFTAADRSFIEKEFREYLTTGGFEVDFHARFPDGKEELIRVCADAGSSETLVREIRALTEHGGGFSARPPTTVSAYFRPTPHSAHEGGGESTRL